MPTLHLGEDLLAELKSACEAEYPREACGLLLGRLVPREGKGPKVHATRLHPSRNDHPSGASRFSIAPQDFVAADSAARDAGLEILGAYHSHPDAADSPSAHDREAAQEAWASVIVAVTGRGEPGTGRATSWRCWRLSGDGMVEETICVC